jgi:hypothetical protein
VNAAPAYRFYRLHWRRPVELLTDDERWHDLRRRQWSFVSWFGLLGAVGWWLAFPLDPAPWGALLVLGMWAANHEHEHDGWLHGHVAGRKHAYGEMGRQPAPVLPGEGTAVLGPGDDCTMLAPDDDRLPPSLRRPRPADGYPW